MPGQLAGYLEDPELVSPGRKSALAAELVKLAANRQQRVPSGLMSQVIEFGASNRRLSAAAVHFIARDPQQQLMQPDRG
jgi:hypothetical protein